MNCFVSAAWRSAVLGAVVAVLSACGGGGGGGDGGGNSGSSAPPPATDAANVYFPTDAGLHWVYDKTVDASFSSFVANGIAIHSLNYPNGGKEYFATTADQISLQGMFLQSIVVGGSTYTGDIAFNDLVALQRNNWTTGFTQAINGKGSITISPTYGKHDLNYSGTLTYIGDAAVSSKLAGFDTKVFKIDLTLTTTIEGQTFSIPYGVTFYLARDVGIVKRVQGGVTYLLSSMTGLDADGDGIVGDADQYPNDGNRWQDGTLYASDDGIALSSVPSYSRLSQTVTIMQGNGPTMLPLAVSGDQGWLSVTEVGNGKLTLTADPTGLATDSLYFCTVTVAASGGTSVPSASAKIRVSLWVGSQDAGTSVYVANANRQIVADPLRPYVYVNNASSIDIYHVYTHALIDSIPVSLTGTEQLHVSSDGSFLYVGTTALQRIALDAPYTQLSSAMLTNGIGDIAYARPQGHSVIIGGHGDLFDGSTLQLIDRHWFGGAQFNGTPQASLLGNRACVVDNTNSVTQQLPMTCYELAYIEGATPDIRFKSLGTVDLQSQSNSFVLGNDGSHAYFLPYQYWWVRSYDLNSLETPPSVSSTASPAGFPASAVDVGASGNVYYGGMGIAVIKPDLTPIGTLVFIIGNLHVSGDEGVVMGTDGSNVEYIRTY